MNAVSSPNPNKCVQPEAPTGALTGPAPPPPASKGRTAHAAADLCTGRSACNAVHFFLGGGAARAHAAWTGAGCLTHAMAIARALQMPV